MSPQARNLHACFFGDDELDKIHGFRFDELSEFLKFTFDEKHLSLGRLLTVVIPESRSFNLMKVLPKWKGHSGKTTFIKVEEIREMFQTLLESFRGEYRGKIQQRVFRFESILKNLVKRREGQITQLTQGLGANVQAVNAFIGQVPTKTIRGVLYLNLLKASKVLYEEEVKNQVYPTSTPFRLVDQFPNWHRFVRESEKSSSVRVFYVGTKTNTGKPKSVMYGTLDALLLFIEYVANNTSRSELALYLRSIERGIFKQVLAGTQEVIDFATRNQKIVPQETREILMRDTSALPELLVSSSDSSSSPVGANLDSQSPSSISSGCSSSPDDTNTEDIGEIDTAGSIAHEETRTVIATGRKSVSAWEGILSKAMDKQDGVQILATIRDVVSAEAQRAQYFADLEKAKTEADLEKAKTEADLEKAKTEADLEKAKHLADTGLEKTKAETQARIAEAKAREAEALAKKAEIEAKGGQIQQQKRPLETSTEQVVRKAKKRATSSFPVSLPSSTTHLRPSRSTGTPVDSYAESEDEGNENSSYETESDEEDTDEETEMISAKSELIDLSDEDEKGDVFMVPSKDEVRECYAKVVPFLSANLELRTDYPTDTQVIDKIQSIGDATGKAKAKQTLVLKGVFYKFAKHCDCTYEVGYRHHETGRSVRQKWDSLPRKVQEKRLMEVWDSATDEEKLIIANFVRASWGYMTQEEALQALDDGTFGSLEGRQKPFPVVDHFRQVVLGEDLPPMIHKTCDRLKTRHLPDAIKQEFHKASLLAAFQLVARKARGGAKLQSSPIAPPPPPSPPLVIESERYDFRRSI